MRVGGKGILGKRKIKSWLKGEEGKILPGGRILHRNHLGKRKSVAHDVGDDGEPTSRYGTGREQTTLRRTFSIVYEGE